MEKLAVKKLTHSDLTFFQCYYYAQKEKKSKQKALNLNSDVVVFNALLNFMNHFESTEQIRADIDMQGEYFNAFACEQLARYFNQRKYKLPIDPVILFEPNGKNRHMN